MRSLTPSRSGRDEVELTIGFEQDALHLVWIREEQGDQGDGAQLERAEAHKADQRRLEERAHDRMTKAVARPDDWDGEDLPF